MEQSFKVANISSKISTPYGRFKIGYRFQMKESTSICWNISFNIIMCFLIHRSGVPQIMFFFLAVTKPAKLQSCLAGALLHIWIMKYTVLNLCIFYITKHSTSKHYVRYFWNFNHAATECDTDCVLLDQLFLLLYENIVIFKQKLCDTFYVLNMNILRQKCTIA